MISCYPVASKSITKIKSPTSSSSFAFHNARWNCSTPISKVVGDRLITHCEFTVNSDPQRRDNFQENQRTIDVQPKEFSLFSSLLKSIFLNSTMFHYPWNDSTIWYHSSKPDWKLLVVRLLLSTLRSSVVSCSDEFLTIEKSELFLTFIGVAKQSCGSLKIVPYSHPKTKDWPE